MQELTNGRYSFTVHYLNSNIPAVFAKYNGKHYRYIHFHKECNCFKCQCNETMTPALLKALILTFITFESTNTTNFKELTAKRIDAWINSNQYATDRTKFNKCPFECK